MAYLTAAALNALGFVRIGEGVRISDLASIHNPGRIRIGDFTRVDDFCILSAGEGGISLGRNVHIGAASSLIGKAPIEMHDFSGLAGRVSLYSSNDDYSGEFMTNPTVPPAMTKVTHATVVLQRHVIVGTGSVILPGVTLGEGCSIGALSLVRSDCEAFGVYFGAPARKIGMRSRALLEVERRWLNSGEPS